jgi:hypothetical protein
MKAGNLSDETAAVALIDWESTIYMYYSLCAWAREAKSKDIFFPPYTNIYPVAHQMLQVMQGKSLRAVRVASIGHCLLTTQLLPLGQLFET